MNIMPHEDITNHSENRAPANRAMNNTSATKAKRCVLLSRPIHPL